MNTQTEPLVPTGQKEKRHFDLSDAEWRDATEGDGLRFEGLASVFDSPSEDLGGFTEVVDRGAFRKVLSTGPDVRLLINHDPNLVLARTTSGTMQLKEQPQGLKVSADLAPTSYAQDLRVLVGRGDMSQMSFGFRVGEDTWDETDDGSVKRTIHSFRDLFDVSVVTFPAYQETSVSMRSVVRGVQIVGDDGVICVRELRELAFSIHRGEIEASDEERQALDAAFAKAGGVSPWVADLARRTLESDDELRQVLDPATGVPFRRLARERRLRARQNL